LELEIRPSFIFVIRLFTGYGGDAIDINKWFGAGIFNVVCCVRGYIGCLTPANLIAVSFANHQFALAGEKNEQLLMILGAMLATGLVGG